MLLLTACNRRGIDAALMDNPLYAIAYGNDLADTLANLIILEDPISKEEGMTEKIQNEIAEAKILIQAAEERQNEGFLGALISAPEETAGNVLYLDDKLYLSPDFYVNPGVNLHLYLVPNVDPRGMTEPDSTMIDLGQLKSHYGAQTYDVGDQPKPELLRSFMLWDLELGRMHGFAQLSRSGS